MDKHSFLKKVESIDVPKEDVLQAFKLGIDCAQPSKQAFKQKKIKKIILSASIAASMSITSTFLVPSFSRALADVPLIGKIYASYNDTIGRNLEEQKLVTQLNQTASSNNIDVTITSAYFDGNVVGVTFDVKGKIKKSIDGQYSTANYKLFNGDSSVDDSIEITTLNKNDSSYNGHIQFYLPDKKLLKNATFPLSFTEIGEKKGIWQFNVPIEQLPPEEVVLNNIVSSNQKEQIDFKVDSILYGKASTSITYRVTYPATKDLSIYQLNVTDDKKNPIDIKSDGVISKNKNENKMTVVRRAIIPQVLKENISHIEVKPVINMDKTPYFIPLNEKETYPIKNEQQPLSIKVNKLLMSNKKLTVDFQIKDESDWDLIKEFAMNGFTIAKGPEIYIPDDQHATNKQDFKVLNKQERTFRATFDTSHIKKFKLDDFSIYVTGLPAPLEINPVQIKLK